MGHVLSDDKRVWIDAFAVRQWPGSTADLDFRPIVARTRGFVLVASHVPAVAELQQAEMARALVPEAPFLRCAFFRVWCLAELASALRFRKPVVILVGAAGARGEFVPERSMLGRPPDSTARLLPWPLLAC